MPIHVIMFLVLLHEKAKLADEMDWLHNTYYIFSDAFYYCDIFCVNDIIIVIIVIILIKILESPIQFIFLLFDIQFHEKPPPINRTSNTNHHI